jgi:phosphate transport system substrate-binding protein
VYRPARHASVHLRATIPSSDVPGGATRRRYNVGSQGAVERATRLTAAVDIKEDQLNQVRRPPTRRLVGIAAIGLAFALVAAGCGKKSNNQPVTAGNQGGSAKSLSGAGATFPQPIYEKWFSDFAQTDQGKGVQVNYQAIGSGGGIKQFTAGTVDFGATDSPMKDDELQAAEQKGGTVIHVPTVLGSIVVTYNLPDVRQPLKMDGQLIGDIFLGKVKSWNAPEIAKLNAGVTLPNLPILTVHRSDSSGTTGNFTKFVAATNKEFDAKIGAGKEVKWVGGVAGKGNDGVTANVQQTKGAVGYVELNYALKNNLKFAEVKNAAGRFVTASVASTTAAANDLSSVPDDFRASLVNAKSPDAYPIATWTFLIVHQRQANADKGRNLAGLLWYMTHDAQSSAKDLGYAPLPDTVVPKIETKIRSITDSGGNALYAG